MRALKVIWYGLMAALFFAGLSTGLREFYLPFVMMCVVVLYSFCLNWWTILSFSFVLRLDRPKYASGDLASLELEVHNEKPFPFAFMRMDVETLSRERERFGFSLLPDSHIAFAVAVPCLYRGVYNVGITKLEINDSFGLVRARFDMRRLAYYRLARLRIRPRIADLTAMPATLAEAKRFGGACYDDRGETYSDVRPYRPGDPFKRAHRAITARRRALFIRTYDSPLDRNSVLIVIDTDIDCGTEGGRYLADLACECAASLARRNLGLGFRVAFAAGAVEPQVLSREADFERFYDSLADLNFDGDGRDYAYLYDDDIRAAYVISPNSGYAALAGATLIVTSLGAAGARVDGAGWARVVRVCVGDDTAAVLGAAAR